MEMITIKAPNFLRCIAAYLFLTLLFAPSLLRAQSKLNGEVTDNNGEALPGVTIQKIGDTEGTITDMNGKFTFPVVLEVGDSLRFSSIGMKTKTVAYTGQLSLKVKMETSVIGLNEVVVVGYGTQAKKDVTGAVAMVGAEDMKARANTQIGALIQGKAPGVQVLSSSGKPSEGFRIRIRGTNSINAGSEPLYVVDGVPTQDTRALNPADIENVTVLKDASSAAIYGSQGSNGVVLITTKRGNTDRPQVTFDTYAGVAEVWKMQKVLNGEQYRDLMTEMGQNTEWDKYQENTDWQNKVFQKGYSQNYQVSVSGKSNKTNYYFSGGYLDQTGVVRTSEMQRANFKINLDQEVTSWLKVGTRMAYTSYSDVDVKDNLDVNQGGVILGSLSTPPIIGVKNPDGTYTSNPLQNWENPLAHTDAPVRGYSNQRMLANVYAELQLVKGLSFRTNFGIDNNNDVYDYFLDPFSTSYGRALEGQGINSTNNNGYFTFENILKYNTSIKKHQLDFLAGSVIQKWNWESTHIERRKFSGGNIQTPNAGAVITAADARKSEKSNVSLMSRVNYSFADRYLLTVNFRADASSIFGQDQRWGYFPSASAGWRISEEAFLKDVQVISDLKLRAGWGIVGNDQIGSPYASRGLIGSSNNGYPIGGSSQPGTYPSSLENRSLKWEESEQINVGLDLALYNGRLRVTADAYQKDTRDLLLQSPLPTSTGFNSAWRNVGQLQNRGIEFNIGTLNIDKAVRWNTDFNISFNRNEVISLVDDMYEGQIAGRGAAILVQEGLPLGSIYGYRYAGVDPKTGNAYYLTKEGETTFTPTPEDREIIGDANPNFIYGMTNTVSYKGWSLMMFIEGAQGRDMLNATRFDTEGMTDPKNQTAAVLRRWRKEGDITDIPKASWGNRDNSRISDRFVEDASYLRIKALTLGYNFPASWLDPASISGLRVYVTGENLFTWTNYSGFDPEVNAFGGSNTVQGIDYGTFPQSRSLIIGLNVTF